MLENANKQCGGELEDNAEYFQQRECCRPKDDEVGIQCSSRTVRLEV